MSQPPFVSVLFAFCVVFPATHAGQSFGEDADGSTAVRGRIVTPEGNPVAGIHLTCYLRDADRVTHAGGCVSDADGEFRFSVRTGSLFYISTSDTRLARFESEPVRAESAEEMVIQDLVVLPRDAVLDGHVVKEDGSPGAGLSYGWHSQSYRGYSPREVHLTDPNGRFSMTDGPREEITFWVEVLPDTVQAWQGIAPNSRDLLLELNRQEYIELPPGWRVYGDLQAHLRRVSYQDTGARLDFALPDLQDNVISLSSDQLKGKVVLVNIFGTWCGGCLAEIPHLIRLREKYAVQGVEVVGIAFEEDSSAASMDAVRRLVAKSKITYPVLFGGSAEKDRVLSALNGLKKFKGYPTTLFVGRDGRTAAVKIGFDNVTDARARWHTRQMEQIIIRLFARRGESVARRRQ
jgi:thiol-disulfide isomerase/thioredoxin